MMDATERFSDRVDNYIRYRPGYPAEVVEALERECGLDADSLVADIGSGTGILSALLLSRGCQVFGVEPNREMRLAAERILAGHLRFRSVAGSAEASTLGDRSVDLITAGQAFHWFRAHAAQREFLRILRPGGMVALVWNERDTTSTPFLAAYEEMLLRFSTDYTEVDHRRVDQRMLESFFASGGFSTRAFPNRQVLDRDGMVGRLLSSSYMPAPGRDNYPAVVELASKLFHRFNVRGRVTFEYTTILHWGPLEDPDQEAGRSPSPR